MCAAGTGGAYRQPNFYSILTQFFRNSQTHPYFIWILFFVKKIKHKAQNSLIGAGPLIVPQLSHKSAVFSLVVSQIVIKSFGINGATLLPWPYHIP